MNNLENRLYQEETLQVLKDLRRDLSQSGSAEFIKNIEKIKGDKGADGISIKSISSEMLASKAIITVTQTDDTIHTFEVERIKGVDGRDGKDGAKGLDGRNGADGLPGKDGLDGRDGLQGKAGTKGKDGQSIAWRGAWNLNNSYKINDAVEFMGSSYIATKDSTGATPTATDSWDLMAQKGRDGRVGGGYNADLINSKADIASAIAFAVAF